MDGHRHLYLRFQTTWVTSAPVWRSLHAADLMFACDYHQQETQEPTGRHAAKGLRWR
jgi:hypothetical protein